MVTSATNRTSLDVQINSLRQVISKSDTAIDSHWDLIKKTINDICDQLIDWGSSIGSRAELPNSTIVADAAKSIDDLLPELKKLAKWLQRHAQNEIRWTMLQEKIMVARDKFSTKKNGNELFICLQLLQMFETLKTNKAKWILQNEDELARRFDAASAIEQLADDLEQAIWEANTKGSVIPARPQRTPPTA